MLARLRFLANIAVGSVIIYLAVLFIKGRPPISLLAFVVICEIAALPVFIHDWIKEIRRKRGHS